MTAIDKDNLIWTVAETKDMFQEYRLWPSFIGTNFDQERRASKGRLPVMIWPEQRRYLNERKEAQRSHDETSSRKRKYEAPSGAVDSAIDSIEAATKKIKKSNILYSFASSATSAIKGVFSWIFRLKPSPSSVPLANFEPGVSLDAISFSPLEQPVTSYHNEKKVNLLTDDSNQQDIGVEDMGSREMQISEPVLSLVSSSSSSSSSSVKPEPADKTRTNGVKKLSNKSAAAEVQMTIFRSLQEHHGYFVGPGDVYGGDYTIYRGGDPSNSHSTATVRVVRHRKMSARDLLSFSRVQNQVAKSAVIGFIDPATKEAAYLVINFQNVSDRA